MLENPQSPEVMLQSLRDFHAQHFPTSPIPTVPVDTISHLRESEVLEKVDEVFDDDIDGLGHYADGKKRTLTDDQIAMFRNSEIQRLLAKQRRLQEEEQEQTKRQEKKKRSTVPNSNSKISNLHWKPRRELDDGVTDMPRTLSYDDNSTKEDGLPKQFIWPTLGQEPKNERV